jgi:hypothetical protein
MANETPMVVAWRSPGKYAGMYLGILDIDFVKLAESQVFLGTSRGRRQLAPCDSGTGLPQPSAGRSLNDPTRCSYTTVPEGIRTYFGK